MRIQSLRIRNFRNLERLDLNVGARTLLVGPNASGKSSVVDALAWVLTGRCRGTDARGVGQDRLVRHGTTEMSVEADVIHRNSASFDTIRRVFDGKPHCTVKDVPSFLGVSAVKLASLIYGDTFFALHHSEARDLLLDLLNVRVDLGGEDVVDLAELDRRHEAAVGRRRDLKAQLAAVHVPEMPTVVAFDVAHGTPDGLRAQVEAAREFLRGAASGLAALGGDVRTEERLVAKVEALAGEHAGAKARVEAHRRLLEEVTKQNGDLAAAEESEDFEQLVNEQATLKAMIDRASSFDPAQGCAVDAKIPCPQKSPQFTAFAKAQRAELKALGVRVKTAKQAKRVEDERVAAEAEVHRQLEYHHGQIDDAVALMAKSEEASGQLGALQERLTVIKVSYAEREAEIETMTDSIADAAGLMDRLVTYDAQRQQHQKADARRSRLADARDEVEVEVEKLGPKGARAEALAASLGAFLGLLNNSLRHFGYEFMINVEPWSVEIKRQVNIVTGERLPGAAQFVAYNRLSGGERLWTSLVLQLAIAEMSGLGWCAIDNTDTVVGQARRVLTGTVLDSTLPQILICMAKGEDEETPDIDGVQVVRMGGVQQDEEDQAEGLFTATPA